MYDSPCPSTYGMRISLTLLMICLPTITIPSCIHSSIRQPDGSHWQNTEQILTNSSNRENSRHSLKLFKLQIYCDFINIEWISILGVFDKEIHQCKIVFDRMLFKWPQSMILKITENVNFTKSVKIGSYEYQSIKSHFTLLI